MSQSTFLGGCVVLAFVFFITARGELPDYMRLVGL